MRLLARFYIVMTIVMMIGMLMLLLFAPEVLVEVLDVLNQW